ncbi:hypothetical protein [Azospirillum canadense]|uniref:hypothetical protein n=1 Tax=Azospirillum canadense TaxID=403962 RepID=UPI002227B83C|nr:hypothetical protein [Azospirillum canadense]MCW2242300.1 hypothetical protein [Azospirillum canadense]
MATEDDVIRQRRLRGLVLDARSRAKRSGRAFDLSEDHAETMYQAQGGRCDVTGFWFSWERYEEALVKHPFAPSIDRRDSQLGYTVDNVRLVCTAVNFGMGQWGQEVYLTLARAAVEKDRTAPRQGDGWATAQREKIAAANALAERLDGQELLQQRRRIAALKRALTLGPEGLNQAAKNAQLTRRRLPTI